MARYIPSLWGLSVWIAIAPFAGFAQVVPPDIWFASVGFWLAGAVFIYDAIIIWPEKGKLAGLSAAIMLMVLGVINVVLGVLVFSGFFNPYIGNEQLITLGVVTLGLGVIALFVLGTVEIISGRHAGKLLKEKLAKAI